MMYYNNSEFMHHGILGQKWGVITKNVGVNYVPIGRKSGSSAGEKVLSGAKAAGGTVAKGAATGAKALVKGAKKVKAEHDAKVADKKLRDSKNHHTDKLNRKQIAKMTDDEIQAAINRRNKERELYELANPTVKAGREFFDNYIKKTVLDLAGGYGRKLLGAEADKLMRDFIKTNKNWDDATKEELMKRLEVASSADKKVWDARDKREKLANDINNSLANDKYTRELIDSMTGITEEQRSNLLNKFGVETSAEKYNREVSDKTRQVKVQNEGRMQAIKEVLYGLNDDEVRKIVYGLQAVKNINDVSDSGDNKK